MVFFKTVLGLYVTCTSHSVTGVTTETRRNVLKAYACMGSHYINKLDMSHMWNAHTQLCKHTHQNVVGWQWHMERIWLTMFWYVLIISCGQMAKTWSVLLDTAIQDAESLCAILRLHTLRLWLPGSNKVHVHVHTFAALPWIDSDGKGCLFGTVTQEHLQSLFCLFNILCNDLGLEF